jgi:hypothetical protein
VPVLADDRPAGPCLSLRKKLGEAGELIETVRGVGYRFHESRLVGT